MMTIVVGDGMHTEDVLMSLAFVDELLVWVAVVALADLMSHGVELECWEEGWRGRRESMKKTDEGKVEERGNKNVVEERAGNHRIIATANTCMKKK